jgi:DNA-binding transcriptional MerR regulator
MNKSSSLSPVLYRIGAVSKLSGIPVPTLRIWQTRYQAFSPHTTHGQHRLYNEDDLRKAALLKALTSQGHGISLIAGLSTAQLQQLLQTGQGIAATQAPQTTPTAPLNTTWAVIGLPLAQRLKSAQFKAIWQGQALPIETVWSHLEEARAERLSPAPDVLMVSVNGLNELQAQQIQALAQQHGARKTLVLYNFGQLKAVASLRDAGCLVHQDPLNDMTLADIVLRTRPGLPSPAWTVESQLIPARQFSDAVLQRVANNPNQVLCECPRHLAELLGQIARFEDYSRDCLNLSDKDAELHAQLNTMAATSRNLFEKALQMVATHEGISLQEDV